MIYTKFGLNFNTFKKNLFSICFIYSWLYKNFLLRYFVVIRFCDKH